MTKTNHISIHLTEENDKELIDLIEKVRKKEHRTKTSLTLFALEQFCRQRIKELES